MKRYKSADIWYNKIIKLKRYKNVVITKKQKNEILELLSFLLVDKDKTIKEQTTIKNLPLMLECGIDSYILRRLLTAKKLGRGVTLNKMIVLYGKHGYDRWEKYKELQSKTNTFEYKNEKYGMTKDEFKEYNNKRSVTEENLIHRHGKEIGLEKWEKYKEKQSYNGCKLDYFIEKHGEEDGRNKYEDLNKKKSHSYDSVLYRFNGDVGKTDEYMKKRADSYVSQFHSKSSQKLFWSIYELLPKKIQDKVYFAELNKEYGVFDDVNKKIYFYDFVITSLGICIEYNGDHYHGNPLTYNSGDIVDKLRGNHKLVDDIWEFDKTKNNTIKRLRNFSVSLVWDSNYLEDKNRELLRCLDIIKERMISNGLC